MAWATGTITSATPHTALSTAIKALFGTSGVANWSFVENVPAGTGTGQSGSATFSVDIYKCAGTGTDANDCGTDFYVGLRIPTTDGAVTTAIHGFEDYSPIASGSNKGMGRRFCEANISQIPIGAGFWGDNTYVTFNTAGVTYPTVVLNTTGFTYWIKLTKNFIFVATLVGVTPASWTVGILDSVITNVADPLPLITGSGNVCSWSNLPGVITNDSTQWLCEAFIWSNSTVIANTVNLSNRNDIWQSSKLHVSRIGISSRAGYTVGYRAGMIRGLVKADLLCFCSAGAPVGLGDTMVVAGNTWTIVGAWASGGYAFYIPGTQFHIITRAN